MTKPDQAFRHQAVELGRFAAAFGIVMAHAMPLTLGRAGQLSLSFFVILTAFLSGQSLVRAPGRYHWWPRAVRLLLPWLACCALFRLVEWKISDPPLGFWEIRDPWSLLAGPEYHLWFLPFLILATATVRPVGRFAMTGRGLELAFSLIAVLALPAFTAHHRGLLPVPLSQWAAILPTYLWGLLCGIAVAQGRGNVAALGLAGVTAAGVIATGGQAFWPLSIPLAAALLWALWKTPLVGNWKMLGDAAFGIYLLHPLMLFVGYKLFGASANRLMLGFFAFALSCVTVFAMQRLPLARRLI
ncbi:MAG: acyltransferase family protein [Paracoccaceae bacterium]